MHCFYAPQLTSLGAHSLSEDEWRHMKALRVKPGENIVVVDGLGSYQCFQFHLNGKQPFIEPLSTIIKEHQPSGVHLYIPMTQQSDRIEWMLEKSTEMGLRGLNIITSKHSEKSKFSIERLERIAIAAMKQSQRKWLPYVKVYPTWDSVMEVLKGESVFIAHCEEGDKMIWNPSVESSPHVLIGPEGDFHVSEIQDVLRLGGVPISLGAARLRTETAGLLVVSKYYL